ncbi:MAG: nucleoside monophosphate kinase [Candidatus Saccharibacteria bacterium]|nr:nucleoside monophosphate kinase [Candidatus Saccharibacteria bacterium]
MIILFGLAGSGKGTQSKALSEIFGWRALSVGQVIRDTGAYNHIIENGNLIPDDEVTRLMARQIEKAESEGFDVILDGYPRTAVQAEWLMENMADKIDGAIILDVPKEELYGRLALRGRADDQEKESIDRRFEIFEQNIYSILPLLEAKDIPVERINGVGEIGTITGRLIATIERFNPNATKQTSDVNGGEIEKSYGE